MRAVIVPLTLIACLFVGYIVWQIRAAAEQARKEKREREKEREAWADRIVDGHDDAPPQ